MKNIWALLSSSRFSLSPHPWIFLPDPAAAGRAIILPRFPVTLSHVMESIKEKPQSL